MFRQYYRIDALNIMSQPWCPSMLLCVLKPTENKLIVNFVDHGVNLTTLFDDQKFIQHSRAD